MTRAVISPARWAARAPDSGDRPTYRAQRKGCLEAGTPDDYADRLIKYIPAEAVTFFLLVSSSNGLEDAWVLALSVIGLLGAEIWSFNRNAKLDVELREGAVALFAYTAAAFAGWALGTSENLRGVTGLSQQESVMIMAAIAFLLPAVSEAIARRQTARR